MNEIDKYIFPLEDYYNNDLWIGMKDDIFEKLVILGSIGDGVKRVLTQIFDEYIYIYSMAGFRVIPIFNESPLIRVRILLNYILQEMLSSNYLISSLQSVGSKLSIAGLEHYDKVVRNESKEEKYTDSKTNSNTSTENFDRSKNDKSMVENAPYNNSIDTIDSPSGKNHFKSIVEDTTTKTINENTEGERTSEINGLSDDLKYSPEIFSKYFELLKEYEIDSYINRIIRKFLYEFNKVY